MKLSVIIPTLNEESYIERTVRKVNDNAFNSPLEIIVVDGGSTDSTIDILKNQGVEIVNLKPEKKGRAEPLNAGAKTAKGDVLLFLDADTLLPPHYDLHIEKALRNQNVAGGAFEFSLDGTDLLFRVIELINSLRYRLRKRYYGDQALFVRKNLFEKVGGFPEKKLLESAYLCERLNKHGNLLLIKRKVKTSPRRFEENGTLRVFTFDIKIWLLDLVGADVDRYSPYYWS